jgi:hypothetical protein
MSVSYIFHKGKRVMFIDYSNCKTIEDTLKVLEMVKNEYLKTNEMLITLNDFNGGFGSKEFMKRATELGKELFNKRTHKTAAIGVTGMKKVLINSYNMFMTNKLHIFDTKEEALDFLVK